MTLIVNVITDQFAIQASDSRLSRQRAESEDDFSKTIVFCGHASVAFAGIAKVGRQSTTDRLAQVLRGVRDVPTMFDVLPKAATEALDKPLLPDLRRRLSINICGFGRFNFLDQQDESLMLPFFAEVTNMRERKTRRVLPRVLPEFWDYKWVTQGSVKVLTEGQELTPDELQKLTAGLSEVDMESGEAVRRTCSLMVDIVREVSTRLPRVVGRGVFVTAIPRAAVDKIEETGRWERSGISETTLGSAYFPPDDSQLVVRSPRIVCGGFDWDTAGFADKEAADAYQHRMRQIRRGNV